MLFFFLFSNDVLLSLPTICQWSISNTVRIIWNHWNSVPFGAVNKLKYSKWFYICMYVSSKGEAKLYVQKSRRSYAPSQKKRWKRKWKRRTDKHKMWITRIKREKRASIRWFEHVDIDEFENWFRTQKVSYNGLSKSINCNYVHPM